MIWLKLSIEFITLYELHVDNNEDKTSSIVDIEKGSDNDVAADIIENAFGNFETKR